MGTFGCQICNTLFNTVSEFKRHITSSLHKQSFQKFFPDAHFSRHWYTPWIFCSDRYHNIPQNILGLSQMTLCFSLEVDNGFYLCHVCEKLCPIKFVVHHVSHSDHFNNYFAYTDPNALNFAWEFPLMNNYLTKELKETRIGVLQVLHLPTKIQNQCDAKTYHQVMTILHQNKLLSVILKEMKQDRMSIQTYRDDANRKHPLLGLQHIVECVCVSQYERKHYLCTLCCLHVPSSMIIRHLLSVDHLFCYFNKWHPYTLIEKESYKNSEIASLLTDLAKQSEKIHGLADIQQVKLEPCLFTVLNARFEDALSRIESMINKSILLPTVKPGTKLEPCTSGSSTCLPSAGEPSASSAAQSYILYCQNCSQKFETDTLYFNHLSMSGHQETFRKNFEQAFQCKPHLPLYNNFTKHNLSCVGVSLVMTILSHQASREPVHVCFACEAVFLNASLKEHMNSLRHLVQSLLYQNPWRLPFGWKMTLDHKSMKLQACKEEEERVPNQQIIRILDVPSGLLPSGATLIFSKVMEKLNRLMSGVPQRETFTKLQDNDRFPLLGKDFLVKYGAAANGWKFLCLLCQRMLSADEYAGHVFGWNHVATFLNKYHPGSLDLNTTTEEILLDLAKQAAHIHCVSNEQIIEFNQKICEVSDYDTKLRLLSAEKARGGKGTLMPCITPKMKLVLRQRQTQEKDLSWNTKATNESNVVENIKCNSEMPSEKAVDSVQSADQVLWIKNYEKEETIEISLQDKGIEPVHQERKTGEHEWPIPSAQHSAEKGSTRKKPCCLSEMDTSDMETEDVDPKHLRPSCPEKREEMPNLPNMEASGQSSSRDTAVVSSVAHDECVLWSYVQKKVREPLIGLSAVYECVCHNHAPIYLCECCHLIIKEQDIVIHLTAAEHYTNYLVMAGEQPHPQGQKWRKNLSEQAACWERSKGYGEAQVVELTSEEFSKLASSPVDQKAIRIVKNLPMQENKKNITCVDTTTANSQEPPQQDGKIEIHPEPSPSKSSLSSKTETNTNLKQDIIKHRPQGPGKSATATASQCLTSTVTITATTLSPTISSSVLSSSKSLIKPDPKDGSEDAITIEDTSLKMGDKTSKPICNFTRTRCVIPVVECTSVPSGKDNSDKLESFASPTIIDTSKPNSKPICTSITNLSANRNMSTPAMTHLKPYDTNDVSPNTPNTTSSIVKGSTKVTNCPPISDAAKEAPELQGVFTIQVESPPSDVVHNCDADSMASEPVFNVALSSNNPLSTTSKSSQTKPPPTATAKSAPKTLEGYPKSTVNQLKLNINATMSIQDNGTLQKIDSFTPTTPNWDPQTPTTEAFEKATTVNCPKVGLDQLLRVTCKESMHTYCFACSVILEKSNHLTSTTHQINCVKAKYPWWSGKPNETKLSDMVALLADNEKALKIRSKQIEVPLDVYKELKSFPDGKAIEKVKGMIRKKSSKKSAQQLPSAATSDVSSSPCDVRFSPSVSVSPCDIMSPDLGKVNSQTKRQTKSIAEPIKKLPVSSPSLTVQKPTSKVAPRIIKGSTTDDLSTLFHILKVMDRTVIGLSFVWECRVVPPKLPTFYLCESCHLTISVNEICEHMTSAGHRLKYLMRHYPRFMYWVEEELLPEMIDELTNDIAGSVLCREEFMDAQTVLLSEECSEWVRTAPFAEALNVVHWIKQEKKTTTLPLIVTSQHDLEKQMEMSISEEDSRTIDSDHTSHGIDGNLSEKCPSSAESDNMPSPPITELPFSPVENPASVCQNVFNQNMSASPKDENQELFEPANVASLNNPTALSQLVPETLTQITKLLVSQSPLTNLPECIASSSCSVDQNMSTSKNENQDDCESENKYMSRPLSHDSAVGSPIATMTTSLTTPKKVKHETDIQEHMALESAPQYGSGSTGESTSVLAAFVTNHNNTKSPDIDSNIQNEVNMFQMLINLIKQNKPVSAESSESNVKKCKPPWSTRWDVRPPPFTDDDVTPKEGTILNEDMIGTFKLPLHEDSLGNGSRAFKQDTEKPAISCDLCQEVLKMTSSSEMTVKTEDIEMHEVKKNEASEHQISMQISHQKVRAPNKEEQPKDFNIGAEHSKIQQSQVQTSQLPQDQVQHEPSNTEAVQIQKNHVQVQQSQVLQIQRPTQVDSSEHTTEQSQDQSQQLPIYSLVSHRPQNTTYAPRDYDYRQTISVMNANIQVSQGPSSTAATVSSCPSSSMLATGGYSHFVQAGYPANLYSHSNIPVENYYYSPRFDYPNQVDHLQTQHYTFMQPFTQNVQSPGSLRWFNPNAPPQPGAQTYAVWSNGAVAGPSNVAYSSAVPFNTAYHQSCINNYSNVQGYNRELQNRFHTESSFPGSENTHFFPQRQ